MDWLHQIKEEMNKNAPSIANEKDQWKKLSIYKVLSQVTGLNKKAYKPQAISFGPYHYGEDNLKPMEVHKHRALLHFLKRCKMPIELIFQKLDQVAEELRDSYESLDPIWTNDKLKFLQMMILDGCFILEVSRANDYVSDDDDNYDENDPVFGKNGQLYVMPYIKCDMLMLENQIPMMVLHTLMQVQTGKEEDHNELLNEKIIDLLNPIRYSDRNLGKCMHVLDVYRKSVIQKPRNTLLPDLKLKVESREEEQLNQSAMELQEAGIRFKISGTRSLRDVSFYRGVLRLPTLVVDDHTEYIFLNLIAFERLHVGGVGNEVTSFVCFMSTIIRRAMDVAILNESGILINSLESDEVVAKLFKSLSKEISMDGGGELKMVRMYIRYYCRQPRIRWRANLVHTYTFFRTPLAFVSLVATIVLFVLTVIQTIYTVGQFYQKEP